MRAGLRHTGSYFRGPHYDESRAGSSHGEQPFRDHVVLEYEIPKWDGDLGRPNTYVPLIDAIVDEKPSLLATHFESQRRKDWSDRDLLRGLMRLRGMECRAASGYAEAFVTRKLAIRAG